MRMVPWVTLRMRRISMSERVACGSAYAVEQKASERDEREATDQHDVP